MCTTTEFVQNESVLITPDQRSGSGTLPCSSAVQLPVPGGSTTNLSLANPNTMTSVDYTIFRGPTNEVLRRGSLGPGGSLNLIVPPRLGDDIIRIQNRSRCVAPVGSGLPVFDWVALVSGPFLKES